jgi:hypothetical protein
MAEDHGLSGTPILEIDLRSVLCGDRAHRVRPFQGRRLWIPLKKRREPISFPSMRLRYLQDLVLAGLFGFAELCISILVAPVMAAITI